MSSQSGVITGPNNLPAVLNQTVKEKGQAKNKWSLVLFTSPHSMHPCVIPHALILSPVERRFLKANQVINEWRGTA